MKRVFIVSMLVLSAMTIFSGCAPKGYARSQVGRQMTVKSGIVQSVRQVSINTKGTGNAIGAIVGAIAGAAAGNTVGGGKGKDVATVVGGTVGGVIGGATGDALDTETGQEVVVKLDNGDIVATVLRINGATSLLHPGDAVNVFFSGGEIANISLR